MENRSSDEFSSLHKQIAQVTMPLFINENFLGQGHSDQTPNGTVTFIKFRNTIYYCTCRHVIEAALCSDLKETKSIQIYGKRAIFNLHVLMVNNSDMMDSLHYPAFKFVDGLDVAYMPVPMEHFQILAQNKGKRFIDFDNYTSPDYSKVDMVHAFGWLSEHKENQGNQVVTGLAGTYAQMQTSDFSYMTRDFSIFSELDHEHGFYFSGMSGGPVVMYDEEIDKFCTLGIIYEGTPGSRESTCANPHGFITKKDVYYKCNAVNPSIFAEWIEKAIPAWEIDERLANYTPKFSPAK